MIQTERRIEQQSKSKKIKGIETCCQFDYFTDSLFLTKKSPISLLFTPFTVTRFAMHRIYAIRINSRGMSLGFWHSHTKTPRGIVACEQ